MRKSKTHETTHKSDDYHTRTHAHTRPRKRTIIALGLLRELGQVDITLSFLLCSHAGRSCSLVGTRTRGRMQRRSQEAVNSSPATMYKQRRRRTRNEESATQSAKWPAAEQELLQCAPCSSYRPATLQPYRPTTLLPPSANRGKRKNGALFTLPHVTLQLGLSLSLWFPLTDNTLVQKPKKTRGSFCYVASCH